MIIKLHEYGGAFSFTLTPESIEDAAKIMRLKMNAKKEINGIWASASRDGSISGSVVIGKVKNERDYIR